MKFKGDIIITDPCYIIKECTVQSPNPDDYMSRETYTKPATEYTEEEKKQVAKWQKASDAYFKARREDDDWSKCEYGQNMEALGINTYLTSDTEYGDWSCTTVRDDSKSKELITKMNHHYLEFFSKYNAPNLSPEQKDKMYQQYQEERKKFETGELILGYFCADAGLVSVFLLEEVLKYNPDFDYHINNTHTTTWIKNFDGDIEITHREIRKNGDDDDLDEDREVSVVGTGNVNFYTTQTGF